MAFERGGIQLVVEGVSKFARDIGHVSAALIQFGKSYYTLAKATDQAQRAEAAFEARKQRSLQVFEQQIKRTNDAIKKQTEAQTNAAKKQAEYTNKIDVNTRAIERSKQAEAQYRTMLDAVNASIQRNGKATSAQMQLKSNLIQKIEEERDKQSALNSGITKANEAIEEQADKSKKAGDMLDELAQKVKDLILAEADAAKATPPVNKGLEMLGGVVGKLNVYIAAFSIALDIAKFAINVFLTPIKLLIKLAQTLVGVFVKVVKFAWDVGKALLSIPIKFVTWAWNGLNQVLQNTLAITLGMSMDRIFWSIGQTLRDLGQTVITAAMDFQLLQIRLESMAAVEIFEAGGAETFNDAINMVADSTDELFVRFAQLAIKSPYSIEAITNTFTLARAYEFTTVEAERLTKSIMSFAAGMGLTDDSMRRIIENFGQMRAQGKMTGTELRDLARGAFVPVNNTFEVMSEMAKNAGTEIAEMKKKGKEVPAWLTELASLSGKTGLQLRELGKTGAISVDLFFEAFQNLVENRFPNILDRMNVSLTVAISNVKDFFQSVVGYYVLTPVFDVLGTAINKVVSGMFSGYSLKIAENFGLSLARLTDIIVNKVIPAFTQLFSLGGGGFFLQKLTDGVNLFSDALDDLTSGKKVSGLGKLTALFGDVGTSALSPLIDVLDYLSEPEVKTGWGTALEPKTAQKAWEIFKESFVEKTVPALREAAITAFNAIKQSAIDALPEIGENVKGIIDWITAIVTGFLGTENKSAAKVIGGVANNIKIIVDNIMLLLGAKSDKEKEDALAGIEEGISGIANVVKDFAVEKFIEFVNTLKDAWSENFPKFSAWLQEFGKQVLGSDYQPSADALASLADALSDLGISILKLVGLDQTTFNGLITKIGEIKVSDIVDFVTFVTKVGELILILTRITLDILAKMTGIEDFVNILMGLDSSSFGKFVDGFSIFVDAVSKLSDIIHETPGIFQIFGSATGGGGTGFSRNGNIINFDENGNYIGDKQPGTPLQQTPSGGRYLAHTIREQKELLGGYTEEASGFFSQLASAITESNTIISGSIDKDIKQSMDTAASNTKTKTDEMVGSFESLGINGYIAIAGERGIAPVVKKNFDEITTTINNSTDSAKDLLAQLAAMKAFLNNNPDVANIVGNTSWGAGPQPPKDEEYSTGGDFVVPPGYQNDSFKMFVESGERVIVLTKAQQAMLASRNERQVGSQKQVSYNPSYTRQSALSNTYNYNLNASYQESKYRSAFNDMRMLEMLSGQ